MGKLIALENQFNNDPNEQEIEATLEEMYLDYNVMNCPLEKGLSQSLGQYVSKNNLIIPSEFLGSERYLNEIKNLISKKTNKFLDDDYQAYLLWKIWQIKRANLNTVQSDKAKIKCLEVNDTMAKTMYKLQGKLSQLVYKANNINCLEEYQDVKNELIAINEKLKDLTDSILLQTQLSIEAYPKLIKLINRPEIEDKNDPSLPF